MEGRTQKYTVIGIVLWQENIPRVARQARPCTQAISGDRPNDKTLGVMCKYYHAIFTPIGKTHIALHP